MARVFVSYRRRDSSPYAYRLFEHLEEAFPNDQIFMDLTIELGEDFLEVINRELNDARAMIVVLGPQWANVTDEDGNKRLHNPNDLVRLEISTALQRHIRVIPVLVGEARFPTVEQVPDDLVLLLRRQAIILSDSHFRQDMVPLIDAIARAIDPTIVRRREQQPLLEFTEHTGWVISGCYKPSNEIGTTEIVLTASYDGTYRQSQWYGPEHTYDSLNQASYSPDGSRIVLACHDCNAYVVTARTQELELTLTGHVSRVTSATFSPDGTKILSSSDDNTAKIWDALSGAMLLEIKGHAPGMVGYSGYKGAPATYNYTGIDQASFDNNGMRVITASYDGTARIWDANTGQELLVLYGHRDWVMTAKFSPDGKHAVTAGRDNVARIWDTTTGEEIRRLIGHDSWIRRASFSPDGRHILTAGNDNTTRIWDRKTGRELRRLMGHSLGLVCDASYRQDGRLVVTVGADKRVLIWDVSDLLSLPELTS